jgi:hypothetical protein
MPTSPSVPWYHNPETALWNLDQEHMEAGTQLPDGMRPPTGG